MRRIGTVLAAFAALMVAGAAAAQTPKRGGTLVYANGTDVVTLDPQFVTDVPTARIVMHVHETLVRQTDTREIVPALAESWSVSDDKLTWTFKLRQGVKFHDGTPFDAAAVKATFDRLLDQATGSPRRSVGSMMSTVTVADPATIVIKTAKPFAPLLAQLSAYNLAIMSPTQFEKEGKNYARRPAGTGPFKLAAWTSGEKLTLARNDDYWGEKALLDRVEQRVVPEDSARVLMLLGGEADVVASVPPVLVPRLKASRDVQLIQKTGFRTIYLGLNSKMKPFDDIRVRQAVAHAIDRDAILKGVLGGIGALGAGIESPMIRGAKDDLAPVPFDKAKAKQLLAEAGHPNGVSSVLYTPTGRYLNDRQISEAIQAQLKEVGITVRLEAPEWATYQQLLNRKDQVPMFLLGKGSPTGDLDMTLNLLAHSTGAMNYFNWTDAEVDKLIQAQRETVDDKERMAMLSKIQERFFEDTTYITLFYEDQIFAARARVHGIRVNPDESVSFVQAWKE